MRSIAPGVLIAWLSKSFGRKAMRHRKEGEPPKPNRSGGRYWKTPSAIASKKRTLLTVSAIGRAK
jgi:hypothetical protein